MADTHGDKPNCSICGSPAAVQLVKIRRGRETEEIQVCHDCRMLIGLGPDTPNMPFDVGDFFIPLPDDLDASIVCPACGRPLHEIRLSGRVGCETCYFEFGSELQAMKREEFSRVHSGSLPESLATLRTIIHAKSERRRKIAEALQREDYEEAARLRDEEAADDN